jgi:hypothetical protein
MAARDRRSRFSRARPGASATFVLERFGWPAPDRLEVAGRFDNLAPVPSEPPTLVLYGERTHHLEADPATLSGPPVDGAPWTATFAWHEPPAAFRSAELRFGEDVAVELPRLPGRSGARQIVRVKQATLETATVPAAAAAAADDGGPAAAAHDGRPAEAPMIEEDGRGELHDGPVSATDLVRSGRELLTAQEDARQARAALEQVQVALSRTQKDLDAERDGRRADAERFRNGLDRLQRLADEGAAAEQRRAQELAGRLTDAEARATAAERDVQELREALGATQEHMRALAAAAEETEALRAALDEARQEAQAASADAARTQARLEAVRRAFADER